MHETIRGCRASNFKFVLMEFEFFPEYTIAAEKALYGYDWRYVFLWEKK